MAKQAVRLFRNPFHKYRSGTSPYGDEDRGIRFARKVAEEAENITREDVDELRDLGFSDADVFNVTPGVRRPMLLQQVVDATGTLPDAVPSGNTGSAAVRPDRGPGDCIARVIRAALGSWS